MAVKQKFLVSVTGIQLDYQSSFLFFDFLQEYVD